jgi:hypothetical protein
MSNCLAAERTVTGELQRKRTFATALVAVDARVAVQPLRRLPENSDDRAGEERCALFGDTNESEKCRRSGADAHVARAE